MSDTIGIEIPDIGNAKRILAIQPHYDDNDISAGGTLAALADGGAELHYLTMSDDLMGVIDVNWSAEESTARLRDDQKRAGEIIGVAQQYWLGYPDAGSYDYFDVRRDMIKHIRLVRPDIIFTVDPWMAYEAHTDHVMAGQAAAEAAILYGLMRIKSEANVDDNYRHHRIDAVVFHGTSYPNTIYDISSSIERKNQAMRCYKAQFNEASFDGLIGRTSAYAAKIARDETFEYGEALKIMPPGLLHGVGEALKY
jgi:LmbE family N-acetylglucosaminyl deacetylase|tara:strand:- start:1927 stop:2685 length:759 start_codon:yes stop_codon:yes gene_type:complete